MSKVVEIHLKEKESSIISHSHYCVFICGVVSWGNMKIHLPFVSFLNTEMAQIVEVFPCVLFALILQIDIMRIYWEIAFMSIPQNPLMISQHWFR